MHTKNEKEMRNWSKIAQIIQYGNAPPPLYEIHRSHTATIFKITFADYHYHILDQLYRPEVPDNAIHLTIPEDPTDMNPSIRTKTVEINVYCMDLRNNVLRAAEKIFDLLETPIKKTFNL